MMLRHMHLEEHARNIEQAVLKTIAEGEHLTADLGGRATNTEYTDAVIKVCNGITYYRLTSLVNHASCALEFDSLMSPITPHIQINVTLKLLNRAICNVSSCFIERHVINKAFRSMSSSSFEIDILH